MPDRIVLVTGATGNQGGAVIRSLAPAGFRLRALTRRPDGDAARALASRGIEVVGGDLDDDDSVAAALAGVWGVFAMQSPYETGAEVEERRGRRFARRAHEAGVAHFVYSSVASAHRRTGIPHFESKWRIEEEVRGLGFPSHAILRPVFFMENLLGPPLLQGDAIVLAMRPGLALQMVALADIGRVAARLLADGAAMNGRAIDLAGDTATMPRAVEALGRRLGRVIRFVEVPNAEIRKISEDFALMLDWFERVGFDADIPALEREFGPMTRLDAWAAGPHPA